MITLETVVARMMELETNYYELQARYHELIHQHEELKDFYGLGVAGPHNLGFEIEVLNINELKERYEEDRS
jgi:hypothetical protein